MKKNAKILSILLCLSMLVGMIAMIATADEPAATGEAPTKVVYGGFSTPKVGYIDKRNGNFTENLYNAASYPASALVDGDAWGFCVTSKQNYNDWAQNGGNKIAAIVFDQGRNPVTMEGIEILLYATTRYCPTSFRVEAVTSENGEWEPVATFTEANSDKYCDGLTATYMFGKTVTAYKLRILIDEFIGKYDDNGNPLTDSWIMQIYEIAPIVPSTVNNVPIAKATMGHYKDGSKWTTLIDPVDAPKLLDSDKQSYEIYGESYSWVFSESNFVANGGKYTYAILLDLDQPATLTQIEVMPVRDGRMWTAQKIVAQVSDAEGNWYTVGTYEDTDWEGMATITFDAVKAYSVRLLCLSIGYIHSPAQTACVWAVGGVYLGCEDGAVANDYPEAPANPEAPDFVTELPIPDVGYYDADGNLVDVVYHGSNDLYGAHHIVDGELKDLVFASDPAYNKAFWAEHQMVILFDLDAPIILDGLEMYIYLGEQGPEYYLDDFTVQIIASEGGEWETIATYTDVSENPEYAINPDNAQQYLYMFDKTVTAYKLRILVDEFFGTADDRWFLQLVEIDPIIGEITEPEQPDPTVPSEPETTEPSEPETTEPSEPDTSITADKVETLNNGDQIVIFYEDGKTVIGGSYADANNKKLSAIDTTFSGEKLVISEDMMILTVSIDADGYITFVTENGKYLTSGATGNSLTLTDEATAYSLWALEETDGGFLVKNVNAAYNNNPQYLEFFNGGFTTYGNATASSMAPYTFNFYLVKASDVQDPTEPSEPEATEPEATEPETTEPEATEPEATEPEATEPEATEPEATEPEATEPEATEPEATEPEATEPEATEPEATEPEATQAPTNAPSNNKDAEEAPKSSIGLIIGIVAAVVVIGAVVFFVIKKKKV